MWDTNLKSFLMLIKETYHLLVKARGNIVINASYAAFSPDPTIGVYSFLKTALVGMVKLLAREFQFDEIRVNGVAPGIIKTRLSEFFWKNEKNAELVKKEMKINRLGEPDDIAGVVSFLASDDAKYVTGETIVAMGAASPKL
jgi:dehydrogenase/reductase SDR family member 4